MTHFTHHLSLVLGEMGIQKETRDIWVLYRDGIHGNHESPRIQDWDTYGNYVDNERWQYFPAYLLDDILTLMPEIYKAFKYDQPIWKCEHYNPKANEPGERGCASLFCTYAGWVDMKYNMHTLLDAFLEGGYPSAEAYLLSIIEKK